MTQRYDAAGGLAFLQSQLTAIEQRLYEVKYQNINYADVIPVSMEAGEHAESVTYYFMDGRAVAKFVGSRAMDVPIAEIGTDSVTVPVKYGATGYAYSNEELRQAMFLNRPLPQLKANAARRAYEEHAQRVAMYGDATHGLPGFIDNPNVTAGTVVDPGSGTEWVNKTPAQILADINDIFTDIMVDSKQVERGNKLCLPTAQWSYIAGTPRSDDSDTTIMQWLINNSPYLADASAIVPLNELAGAGAGSTDRMIAYTMDMEKLVFHMPLPLRFLPPQAKGLGFQVPGEYKLSGVEFRYPGSARYGDGI